MSGVGCSHHILSIEHLLSQLGNGHGSELLASAGGERSKADHEEVKTREGDHVDGELAEIRVELTRELRGKIIRSDNCKWGNNKKETLPSGKW